jgi:hypothetical protein
VATSCSCTVRLVLAAALSVLVSTQCLQLHCPSKCRTLHYRPTRTCSCTVRLVLAAALSVPVSDTTDPAALSVLSDPTDPVLAAAGPYTIDPRTHVLAAALSVLVLDTTDPAALSVLVSDPKDPVLAAALSVLVYYRPTHARTYLQLHCLS